MKRTQTLLALATLAALPLVGQAAAYQEGEVAAGGTVTGKVTFSGADPAPTVFPITKNNDVCGDGNREIDFVRVTDGALNDVVVYLDKVTTGKPFPADLSSSQLDQKGCEFKPFLGVMRNDSSIAAVNSDPVLHNIHTYEILGRAKKTVFNVSQPEPGIITKAVNFKRGVAMKVECDAHDFMHSFVFVANNPYFAVVGADGSFTIDQVPPGSYTIKAWHGTLPEQKGKVEVAADGTATVDFQFQAK